MIYVFLGSMQPAKVSPSHYKFNAIPVYFQWNLEYLKAVYWVPFLFIVYMNNIPDSVFYSNIYLFAGDTKCFKHIIVQNDMDLLQSDINCLFNWSSTTHLSFHPSKSCYLSFNQKFPTSYTINGTTINSLPTYKDFGVLISNNLELRFCPFSQSISSSVKVKLYISLVRSQIMYCSPVWRPHLMKDITKIKPDILNIMFFY